MKKIFIYLASIMLIFSACDDYLDLVPEDDILTIEDIFKKKNTTLTFLNSCYKSIATTGGLWSDPAICGADEVHSCAIGKARSGTNEDYAYGSSAYGIADGLQHSAQVIMDRWSDKYLAIRYCNEFIKGVDNVYNMTNNEKVIYKAEARAMKAYYYFELVRQYGPISLVHDNIGVEVDAKDMQIPRSHIDTCFKEIVRLLDLAIPHIRNSAQLNYDTRGHFNREAAYALKARVLAYAASPLFNGNDMFADLTNINGEKLFSATYDPNKWLLAANATDEAIEFCEQNGKKLLTGNGDQTTEKLNTIKDIHLSVIDKTWQAGELIFGVYEPGMEYGNYIKLPRYNSDEVDFFNDIKGIYNPTVRMAELYYTENGLPIDMDKDWIYEDRFKVTKAIDADYVGIVITNEKVLNLHQKREPRFYANIAFDKGYWFRNGKNKEVRAQKDQAFGTSDSRVEINKTQNLTGYWCKKFIPDEVFGGKEPVLRYNYPWPVIRLPELYLLQAECWNEVNGPTQKVYDAIDKVRARAGIPKVEDAWSNSKNPSLVFTKEGFRKIVQQETMIEFAFEGHRFWDLRRWLRAGEELNKPIKGWNVFGEDNKSFYNLYQGPIIVNSKNKFISPRDYFWPLRDVEVLKSNIKQNLGW